MLKFTCSMDVGNGCPDPEELQVFDASTGKLHFTTCRDMDENFRETVLNREQVAYLHNQLGKWLMIQPVNEPPKLYEGEL